MFGVHSLSGNGYGYSPLTNRERTEKQISESTSSLWDRLFRWLVLVLALSCVAGLGFLAGRMSNSSFYEKADFQCQYIKTRLQRFGNG
jgi:hypothetical protein